MVITIWVLSNGYYYIYISITGKNLRHQKTIKHGDQGINIRHFTRKRWEFHPSNIGVEVTNVMVGEPWKHT